jgi:hypothetical protein
LTAKPPHRIALLTVFAAAIVLAVVPTAFAGKGGGHSGNTGSSGSVSLVLLNSTDGVPHWNQQVTFNVSTSATTQPFVTLNCYQGGVWVYTASAGFFPDYLWSQNYTLASSAWMSGAADCTARLYSASNGGTRTTTLATLSFHVYA